MPCPSCKRANRPPLRPPDGLGLALCSALLAVLLLAGPALAVAPAQLLPNGGFENGAEGWTALHGSLATSYPPVRSGSRAGRLLAAGDTELAWIESAPIPIVAGSPYTLSGAVHFSAANVAAAQLAVVWYAGLSSTLALAEPAVTAPLSTPGAAWQSFPPRVAQAPPGARAARLQARIALISTGAPAQASFDDLILVGEPGAPLPTATPTRTPTPTAAPSGPPPTTAAPGDILISEVQAHPASGGSAGEWLELYNRTGGAILLRGWSLADNLGTDRLPDTELAAGTYAVVAADEAAFRANFSAYAGALLTVTGGLIGNGLADAGDRLLLRDGAGAAIDALSFGDDASVFDPPAPAAAAGQSLERQNRTEDTNTAADFAAGQPSPGQAPLPPTPTPSPSPTPTWQPGLVRINEFLPSPHDLDWDGDGQAGSGDEWIELFNPGPTTIDLGNWLLDDAAGAGSKPYRIPNGVVIYPLGYLLFYHRDTGLSLNNDGDTVRLLYPDGATAGEVPYGSAPYDRSFSRTEDGAWSRDYAPSPGGPNPPPPPAPTAVPRNAPPPPALVPIGQARGAPRDAAVAIEGRLSVPPGVFGRRVAYVEDGSAGIRLQHWGRDLPALAAGDTVRVEGRLTTVYGEVTLNVREIWRLGAGPPVAPAPLATGQAGAWWEGRLVQVAGEVVSWDGGDLWLDDGSGNAQVRLRASTGILRPEVEAGQFLRVTGVVGQSSGRWLVLPRRQDDLSPLPARLPDTGSL